MHRGSSPSACLCLSDSKRAIRDKEILPSQEPLKGKVPNPLP